MNDEPTEPKTITDAPFPGHLWYSTGLLDEELRTAWLWTCAKCGQVSGELTSGVCGS